MASILKRTYTPRGPDGKPARNPDGSLLKLQCEHYTIQYRDAAGKLKRVRGYEDKAATKQLAAKLESQLARGEQGLVDPYRKAKSTLLSEHVRAYVDNLRTEGCSEMHVYTTGRRLAVILEGTDWTVLGEITPDSFLKWRSWKKKNPSFQTRKDLRSKGTSAATLNQFLDAVNAFLNWCVDTDRMAANPLGRVEKVEGPKVRLRRALSDQQVSTLLAVAGEDRKLVYRVGLAIGLRRSELAALKWGDVGLSAIPPYVQLRAEATKARRGDRVFLPVSLAEDLRHARPNDISDVDPVFPHVPSIEVWKDDLKAAGIDYLDAMKRQVDFHAGTRKTLCTRMNRAGKPLAVAMKIMRHTDSRLTLVDYNDDQQIGLDDVLPEVVASAAIAPPAAASSAGA